MQHWKQSEALDLSLSNLGLNLSLDSTVLLVLSAASDFLLASIFGLDLLGKSSSFFVLVVGSSSSGGGLASGLVCRTLSSSLLCSSGSCSGLCTATACLGGRLGGFFLFVVGGGRGGGSSIGLSLVASVDLSFGRSLSVDGNVVFSAGSNFLLDNLSLDLLDKSSALFLTVIVRRSSDLASLSTGLLCSSSSLGRTTTLLRSRLCLLSLFVIILSLGSSLALTLVFILGLRSDFLALLSSALLGTTFLDSSSGGGGSGASSRTGDLLAADLVPAGAGDAGVFVAQFGGDGVPVGLQKRAESASIRIESV